MKRYRLRMLAFVLLGTSALAGPAGALVLWRTPPRYTSVDGGQFAGDMHANAEQDRALVRQIRTAIMHISSNARKMMIIASEGKVTLSGTVRSAEEKQAIEEKAREIAGDDNLTSEVRIDPTR